MSERKIRFDVSKIDAGRRDQNGYLVADANVTRTGVFIYRDRDGGITRELRHPDEVFKPDSLATLANRPVTDGHPAEGRLNSRNTKKLAVGSAVGDIKHDAKFVKATLQVVDEDVIAKALDEKNPVREVSCGYDAEVVKADGVYNGERYDHIQKNIVYNHIALVPRGRAGSEVRLKVDHAVQDEDDAFIHVVVRDRAGIDQTDTTDWNGGGDGIKQIKGAPTAGGEPVVVEWLFDKSKGWDLDKANNWVETQKGKSDADPNLEKRDMLKIVRDLFKTKTFKSDAFELKLEGNIDKDTVALQTVMDKLDEARNHVVTLEGKIDNLQAKNDALQDSGRVSASTLQKLVQERQDACDIAHFVGLKDYATLETDDMKRAIVIHTQPSLKSDASLTADYVNGRYEAIRDQCQREVGPRESLTKLKFVSQHKNVFNKRDEDNRSPRDRFLADSQDMYKDQKDRQQAQQ